MASVVMADDGIAFDGAMAETGPLGGAETALSRSPRRWPRAATTSAP